MPQKVRSFFFGCKTRGTYLSELIILSNKWSIYSSAVLVYFCYVKLYKMDCLLRIALEKLSQTPTDNTNHRFTEPAPSSRASNRAAQTADTYGTLGDHGSTDKTLHLSKNIINLDKIMLLNNLDHNVLFVNLACLHSIICLLETGKEKTINSCQVKNNIKNASTLLPCSNPLFRIPYWKRQWE